MRCEYKDGLNVDYAGSLRMKKGNEVNVFLSADDIPAGLRGDLDSAAHHNSCRELRIVADEIAATIGTNLPEK